MIGLLLPLALAAEPQIDAPDVLPIDLPPTGVFRVPLPPEVPGLGFGSEVVTNDNFGGYAYDSGDRVALRDASAQPVPFVVLTTDTNPASTADLDLFPVDTHVWRVGPTDNVVETLRLDFLDDLSHPLDVMVDGVGTTRFATGTVNGETVTQNTVAVPRGHGPWFVRADAHLTGAVGEYHAETSIPPLCETVQAAAPTLVEEGRARYVIDLPGTRWVSSVKVLSSEVLYSRTAWVRAGGSTPDYNDHTAQLRKVAIEGATIDQSRVDGLNLHTDQLSLDIADDHGRVLPVEAFEVCSVQAALLVRDAGQGPLSLYVGGTADAPSSDLSTAEAELLRQAQDLPAGALGPNPGYVPREEREGVDAAGAPIAVVRWQWSRAIQGSGWARIPLDKAVLAHASSTYADLRVIDAEGRQIPYVLRRTGAEREWETGALKRTEEGSVSLLRIPLGDDDAPVATVTLFTDRSTFHRRVVILRDRGTVTEELRALEWEGSHTGTLSMAVNDTVGRELLLRIENGDNPPLEVSAVRVTYPEVELRAHVPEGAKLLYGARTASPPTYDLGLLQASLERRKLPEAALGPEETTQAPELGAFEKVAVFGAIATLAAALFVMLARLVFATRVPDEPEPAPAGAPVSAAGGAKAGGAASTGEPATVAAATPANEAAAAKAAEKPEGDGGSGA